MKRVALRVSLGLLALVAGPARFLPGQSVPTDWSIDPAQSRLMVNVFPGGILASALHTHHFQPDNWSGEVAWDPSHPGNARVDVRIAADSLRDHQPKLSAKDVAKVEGQVRGAEILDSARFPRILFEARRLEAADIPSSGSGEFRATLVGTLTLRGKSRPLQFPIQGHVTPDGLRAATSVTFRQTDFGIKPYKTALGAIAVKDEITVDISLVAIPRKPE